MALQRGDKITSLEGVDFGGSNYAVVLDVDDTPEAGKTLISLFWPDQGVARRYKISDKSVGVVDPSPPKEEVPEETDYDIPESAVDELRLKGPGRSEKTIREFIPDSYFPKDPNYPSTLTDVSWRPTTRWSPFPRFYHYTKRQAMKGYTQIEVEDLVDAAGGLEHLKKLFEHSEDVYSFLMQRQEDLMDKLFDAGYREVGEVSATRVMDWADTHFYSREASTMRRRARRQRVAERPILGHYFESRLKIDFADAIAQSAEGIDPEDIEELYELTLDSHVGEASKARVDEAALLIKELNREGLQHYSDQVGQAVAALAVIYYFG